MKKLSCALLGGLVILAVNVEPILGMPLFKKEFEERYIDDEGSPLAISFGEAKCNVCHVGKNREDRNAYGEALAEHLDLDEFKRGGRFYVNRNSTAAEKATAAAEIQAALEAVESLESPTGDTYLERIEANLLPIEFVPAPDDDE